MRKVVFKRWIEIEYVKEGNFTKPKPGTNCWGPMNNKGFFHQWGVSSIEVGETVATDTVAIVENPDGTVERIAPESIKFID